MNERDTLRTMYIDSWQKYKNKRPLEPLEIQIVDVILAHPEYHTLFEDSTVTQENFSHDNPFLHLGLHLAIREQIATNRPLGVRSIYQTLLAKHKDALQVEHTMMDCLAEMLWHAEQSGKMPDEAIYLERLKQRI